MLLLFTLFNIAQAKEHTISVGLGPYYGGVGVSYIYEPIVGLGIQAGAGLGGLAMGARWQPEWLSGGYSQLGLAKTVRDRYAPNFAVGKKFGQNLIIFDVNAGVGAKLNGTYDIFLDIGMGCNF